MSGYTAGWTAKQYRILWNELHESGFSCVFGVFPDNDAVYSHKEVEEKLKRGDIDERQAEEMLSARYELNKRGERVVRNHGR